MLFGGGLDTSTLEHKYSEGARIDSRSGDGASYADGAVLFVVDAEGQLHPATEAAAPDPKQGDELVLLSSSRRS